MDYEPLVTAVGVELDGFATAVAAGPTSDRVPTCDDWTVADLAVHVGEFCGFWSHVLCEAIGREKTPFPDPPSDTALADWIVEVGGALLALLDETPGDLEVWTWDDSDRSARFVARRSAHELALHRYDAQSARDACRPIAPVLAADGIDEVLRTLVNARKRSGSATGQTMHLHGTDVGLNVEHFVTLASDRVEVTDAHARADLALRGEASDLELLLYRRPPLGEVERMGDGSVLGAWYQEFVF